MTRRRVLALLPAVAGSSCARQENSSPDGQPRHRVADVLAPAALDRVQLGGYLGRKIDLCVRNRIFAQNWDRLVAPFRQRAETACWQTEFWGKWFLSAAAACQHTRNAKERARLGDSVQAMLATQTADGYIGNYAAGSHLKSWDIWGRKYTLLGLLDWFDMTGDAAALAGARRLAGHLMTEVGPAAADIIRCGLFRGMASSSVLEPIVLLHRRTGDERYLRFAEWIVSRWSAPDGPQLIEKAFTAVPVGERFPRPKKNWFSWENGEKAYEMMSCYAGLLELYRETGHAAYRDAAMRTHASILSTEINAAGSGSSEECWYSGRARQTQPAKNPMETCVTVTWMHFCAHLLRLTGDPRYADAIETAAYNALLGAMTPDGSGFAKYSPLEGLREFGEKQCGMELNCCEANGPRGVMLLPQVAVMMGAEGPAFNLYSEGAWDLRLPSGAALQIEARTDYPRSGVIDLTFHPARPESFPVRFRIPPWSAQTSLTVNGSNIGGVHPGTYAGVERRWKPGDRVSLQLDLRGRVLRAADGERNYAAVARGPLVLARDARLGQEAIGDPVAGFGEEGSFTPLEAIAPPPGIDLAFSAGAGQVRLCDYASAGNTWAPGSRYRVWMPERRY
ncbi:MAG: beta-L-arabinofuranosidase domain-containing protein [Bryobacteraceae bacterium]